jgi:hypothetical protein
MHVNNYTLPKPAESVLDQCYQVLIGDPAFKTRAMKTWCRENNLSLIWSDIVATEDTSANYDHIAAFYFIEARDATMFSLKFK